MYSYLLIILVIIVCEMNGINIISSNFTINYEIYIAEILKIINKQKEKLVPIMVRIGYNLIYCVSLCQIRYNRIKNVVSPKINILGSSINNYLKELDSLFLFVNRKGLGALKDVDKGRYILSYLEKIW